MITPPAASAERKILLLSTHFYPSVGGVESFLAHLGTSLSAQGWEVHLATGRNPLRTELVHQGIHIHEFCNFSCMDAAVAESAAQVEALICNGGFEALIMLSDTADWARHICTLPQRPRLIYLPVINFMSLQRHIINADLAAMFNDIRQSDVLCAITEAGCDRQLFETAGIAHVFLPHAVPAEESSFNFRAAYGIPSQQALFVHAANFYEVKNHCGLLQTLHAMPGDFTLALFGNAADAEPETAENVRRAAANDSRVLLLQGRPRLETIAGIREADVLLLSSRAEGCPLCILEAMSLGTPWLATPTCGSVLCQTGGLVAELEDFPAVLTTLTEHPAAAEALGELGRTHHRLCFSPEAVMPAFAALANGAGTVRNFSMPPALQKAHLHLARKILSLAGLC